MWKQTTTVFLCFMNKILAVLLTSLGLSIAITGQVLVYPNGDGTAGGSATNAQPPSTGLTNASAFLGLGRSNRLAVLDTQGFLTNAYKLIRVETNQSHILSNIIAGASSGDVIQLGVGTFRLNLETLKLPVGVTLRGHSRDATIISGNAVLFTNGTIVVLNSSNLIEDLTIVCANSGTSYQGTIGFQHSLGQPSPTNATIRNVALLGGQTDNLYFTHSNYFSVYIYNSVVRSKWDMCVVGAQNATDTNYVEIWNSSMISDLSGATHPVAISNARSTGIQAGGGNGMVRLINCHIVATNANDTYAILAQSNGKVRIENCVVEAAGTNNAALVDNITSTFAPSTSPIVIANTAITDADAVAGSVLTYVPAGFSKVIVSGAINATGNLSHSNGTAYVLINDSGVYGDDSGTFQVGNFNGPFLDFVTSTLTIDTSGARAASLGAGLPYDTIKGTNFAIGKGLTIAAVAKTNTTAINAGNGVNQYANLVVNTNLEFVPLAGADASNSISIKVSFTQDSTGTRTLTFNGAALGIDTNANSVTDVLFWVQNGVTNISPTVPFSTSVSYAGQILFNNGRGWSNGVVGPGLVMSAGGVLAADPVLTNLVGTVAKNVTNENSTALQIDSGTLTLSPSVLSNLNASTIDIAPGNIVTNVIAQKWNIWTNYVQTVSNFVFSFNTNRYELKNQTNVVFTNIVEEATAVGADMAVHIHNTTGVTMGLVWPAYGAQHGYFFQTNINNPILTTTTLTTGKHGVAAFTAFGTNLFATWTEWP